MNAAGAPGARSNASASASGVTPWAMPSSMSYSGATKRAVPPLSTSPSIRLACELRWRITRVPGGARARHSAWLPWVAPLVRNQARAAPYASAASSLGALVRRRRRAHVDPLDVLRHVEQQRPVAERGAQPRVGALAALVPGDVEAQRAPESVGGDRLQVGRGRLRGRLRVTTWSNTPSSAPAELASESAPADSPAPRLGTSLIWPLSAGRTGRSRRGRRRARARCRPSRGRSGGP